MDNNLKHHGILGMKWGIRRFQNKDGSLTAAGKKRYDGDTKDSQEDVETRKQNIIKSKSVKDLYDNADLFTTQELQSAYNRLVLERNIANLSASEVSKGEKFINNVTKWGKKTSDLITTGTNLYKSVDTVRKMFGDESSTKKTNYRSKKPSLMTDEELGKSLKRALNEKALTKALKELDD
jgi:hypothetical protein